jgi:hypothetical protein
MLLFEVVVAAVFAYRLKEWLVCCGSDCCCVIFNLVW